MNEIICGYERRFCNFMLVEIFVLLIFKMFICNDDGY